MKEQKERLQQAMRERHQERIYKGMYHTQALQAAVEVMFEVAAEAVAAKLEEPR